MARRRMMEAFSIRENYPKSYRQVKSLMIKSHQYDVEFIKQRIYYDTRIPDDWKGELFDEIKISVPKPHPLSSTGDWMGVKFVVMFLVY